jgi:serine protease Do
MKQGSSKTSFLKGLVTASILSAMVFSGLQLYAKQSPLRKLWHSTPATYTPPPIRAYDFSNLVTKIKPAVFNLSVTGKVYRPKRRKRIRRRRPRRNYRNRWNRWRDMFPFGSPNDPQEQNDSSADSKNDLQKMQSSPFRYWKRYYRRRPRRSRGSGFFINPQGYALTNHHVVRNAGKIKAILLDGREFPVKVIGKAPRIDLALIKIVAPKGTRFPYTFLGNSDATRVGEPAIAIGNARGLGFTVTAGIISAKGRILTRRGGNSYDNYIQTDAAINHGNSGGPLFNRKGEVIGINTAILRNGRGIGFAVPINLAKRVIGQLKRYGKVRRAQLGVYIQKITPRLAKSFGLKTPHGALINRVLPNSPAARAGVKVGDVVLKFDGKKIKNFSDLPRLVAFTAPGTRTTMTVLRGKKRVVLRVRLKRWGSALTASKDNPKPRAGTPFDGPADSNKALNRLGVDVEPLNKADKKRLKLGAKGGLRITDVEPSSAAYKNGVRRGDIILEVNRKRIGSIKGLARQIKSTRKGENILLLIRRGTGSLFLAFPMTR